MLLLRQPLKPPKLLIDLLASKEALTSAGWETQIPTKL